MTMENEALCFDFVTLVFHLWLNGKWVTLVMMTQTGAFSSSRLRTSFRNTFLFASAEHNGPFGTIKTEFIAFRFSRAHRIRNILLVFSFCGLDKSRLELSRPSNASNARNLFGVQCATYARLHSLLVSCCCLRPLCVRFDRRSESLLSVPF